MKKIVIYSRVSTDTQTLEQQERTVFEWLQNHGLKATDIIQETGVSGGVKYSDRKLGKDVLPMLQPGDLLIVSEISRLGRSMADLNKLVNDELKQRGVRLVVVQMGIDLDCSQIKAIDEMLLFAFGFAAQLEKELIQSRTKSAMEVRKKELEENGFFVSKTGKKVVSLGRPKGADTETAWSKSADIRREKAKNNPTNKIVWELISGNVAADGIPSTYEMERVAEQLNRMGVKTPTGLNYTTARVRSTYHNLKNIYR